MKFNWTLFFGSSAALAVLGAAISIGAAFVQWLESPIAIRPFTIVDGARTAGISAIALADQTKAHISEIYSESGDLFQKRKLGEPTVPLDVKIGDTSWSLQSAASALGIALTSADVSGRIVQDGEGLILQWTTVKPGGVVVDKFPIAGADTSLLANVDEALACLALRTVAALSPDVAANYLQKKDEAGGSNFDKKRCLAEGDVQLYSRVSKDEALSPAARVNSLVGLSVHFSSSHQLFEELSMAEAATDLASRTLSCDDDKDALSSWWRRLKCRVTAYRPFNDKNLQAEVAAWMQLGVARSDYAGVAPTLQEMHDRRHNAIEAYERVIAINDDYALAYDAIGLQHSYLNETKEADEAYRNSLERSEASPAHLDFGLLLVHGNDFLNDRDIRANDLRDAEVQFRKAMELSPDYWDAYDGLGYVLYRAGKLSDAVDVLEAVVQHDESNHTRRLLLGFVYAGQCRFDAAKASFQSAYDTYIKDKNNDNALNVISDWGKVLARLGLSDWAIAEETRVLAAKPTDVNALRVRGEIEIETSGMDPFITAAGLADLKAAVDNDSSKADDVLSAYLEALVQTGRAGDAVDAYESWSREGHVPPLATATTSGAVILPATPNTRLAYAEALLKNHQWQSASREFDVLLQLGVAPGTRGSAELHARSANGGVDDAILTQVSTLSERNHGCNLPAMTRQPLLTDSGSLIPVQELRQRQL